MILDDVQANNWRACTALEVEEPQQRFVASVAYYLALCAYGDSPWRPLAVRAGDEVVGFVMWGIDPADESFWIGGLIIERRRERMGRLGRPKWARTDNGGQMFRPNASWSISCLITQTKIPS